MILPLIAVLLVGSPDSKLRVVDEASKPLAGLKVVREWQTSEEKKGTAEAITDKNGEVSFPRVETSISLFKRLTKPLLVFVPASCGPSWEIYGMSTYRIYTPGRFTLKFDSKIWKRDSGVWKRSDGLCIRDPDEMKKYHPNENYQEFYFFNITSSFDFTLMLFKEKEPNQAPEPTPTTVTPPAGQEARQP